MITFSYLFTYINITLDSTYETQAKCLTQGVVKNDKTKPKITCLFCGPVGLSARTNIRGDRESKINSCGCLGESPNLDLLRWVPHAVQVSPTHMLWWPTALSPRRVPQQKCIHMVPSVYSPTVKISWREVGPTSMVRQVDASQVKWLIPPSLEEGFDSYAFSSENSHKIGPHPFSSYSLFISPLFM